LNYSLRPFIGPKNTSFGPIAFFHSLAAYYRCVLRHPHLPASLLSLNDERQARRDRADVEVVGAVKTIRLLAWKKWILAGTFDSTTTT
jgi:hypothetical protein